MGPAPPNQENDSASKVALLQPKPW